MTGMVNTLQKHSTEVEAHLLIFLFANLKNYAVCCNMKLTQSCNATVLCREALSNDPIKRCHIKGNQGQYSVSKQPRHTQGPSQLNSIRHDITKTGTA